MGLGAALSVGLWLAALNVKYRDFRYVIPFVVQFGFFVSPVGYPSDWFHSKLMDFNHGDILYGIFLLNPMVGVIDGFRWAIGGQAPLNISIVTSILVIACVGATGLTYFRRTEKRFADII
jgi:lipopolysaccharide transport system permease protein